MSKFPQAIDDELDQNRQRLVRKRIDFKSKNVHSQMADALNLVDQMRYLVIDYERN